MVSKHDKTYGHCCVTFINSFVPFTMNVMVKKIVTTLKKKNLKPYSSMVFHVAKIEKKKNLVLRIFLTDYLRILS